MRIAHASRTFVAVLHLTVLFISANCRAFNSSGNNNNYNNSSGSHERYRHSHYLEWSQKLTLRDKQLYIIQESGSNTGGDGSVDCCPSVMEMTEPLGGTNEQDVYVTLYRDQDNHQRFYESSCAPGVENNPCRFIDRKLYNQSRCVQQYSYSYALLKDTRSHDDHHHQPDTGKQSSLPIFGGGSSTPNGGGGGGAQPRWMMGYIKVRSGCKCTLFPKREIRAKLKKAKSKRLHLGDSEHT